MIHSYLQHGLMQNSESERTGESYSPIDQFDMGGQTSYYAQAVYVQVYRSCVYNELIILCSKCKCTYTLIRHPLTKAFTKLRCFEH